MTNCAPVRMFKVMETESKEQEPKPKKPTGSAGMTPEEEMAATERAKAEWKAKRGDKLPKVH